ncbi:hypothetical protein DCS_07212 [Drechmeria coniospora]|uniref:Uncharacterized protein n=1 Tax=Drechmeria coniospora TaxID=98403 RepID=A0A151GDS1_DRECN|nr:hypothetical protein DCS_07212 [Drechmeria coniospora]KYK55249.1 hypothetical protein DCS_07212 [Drechmeria coniospora]
MLPVAARDRFTIFDGRQEMGAEAIAVAVAAQAPTTRGGGPDACMGEMRGKILGKAWEIFPGRMLDAPARGGSRRRRVGDDAIHAGSDASKDIVARGRRDA